MSVFNLIFLSSLDLTCNKIDLTNSTWKTISALCAYKHLTDAWEVKSLTFKIIEAWMLIEQMTFWKWKKKIIEVIFIL